MIVTHNQHLLKRNVARKDDNQLFRAQTMHRLTPNLYRKPRSKRLKRVRSKLYQLPKFSLKITKSSFSHRRKQSKNQRRKTQTMRAQIARLLKRVIVRELPLKSQWTIQTHVRHFSYLKSTWSASFSAQVALLRAIESPKLVIQPATLQLASMCAWLTRRRRLRITCLRIC